MNAQGTHMPGVFLAFRAKPNTLWFMFLRAMVTTLLLAITLLYQIKDTTIIEPPDLLPIYSLIGLTYLVTIICTLLIERIKNLKGFVISQIMYDILFTTSLIYITGTQEAIFTFLYLLTIAFSSILFLRTGALYTAALASICFSTLLILDPIPNSERHLLTLFFNNVAFFLVALLSGYISEQYRRFRLRLHQKEESVKELEDLNKTIIDNMKSGLLTTDLKNQIIYFNLGAEQITGLSLTYIYKKNIFEIFPNLRRNWLTRITPKMKAEQQALRRSFKYQKSPSEELTLGFSLSPLRNASGTNVGHILIFEDLTKILEMEQHLRRTDRLAAVGKLAAGIAHEIRNPLASVSGSIEVLSREMDVKDENKKLMDIILKETDRLNGLVTEFLEYVRPAELKKTSVNLNELIEETTLAISMDKSIGKSAHIKFNPEKRSLKILGNKEKLKQILWNLFINAHQAMPQGGGIHVRTYVQEGNATIEISDEGEGMPENVVHKIFDPFFTTKPRGTGLGLSVVHKIIEAHGGRISVNSEMGKGTTFTIILPIS